MILLVTFGVHFYGFAFYSGWDGTLHLAVNTSSTVGETGEGTKREIEMLLSGIIVGDDWMFNFSVVCNINMHFFTKENHENIKMDIFTYPFQLRFVPDMVIISCVVQLLYQPYDPERCPKNLLLENVIIRSDLKLRKVPPRTS